MNKTCAYYKKQKGKDIIRRGKNTAGHQQFFCLHCRKYTTETKGTFLFNKKLSESEIKNLCKIFVEKNGVRSAERLTGHHRDTIGRYLEGLAEHAEDIQNRLGKNLGLKTYEVDELWTNVKKNKRKLSSLAVSGLEKVKCGDTRQ
jgi:transposase-like protein